MESNFEYIQLSIGELYENKLNKKIIIPQFQRTIKWNAENRISLIESIQRGNPIGAILVKNDKLEGTFTIIDGLQRTTTIFDFFNNSYKYISRDNISDKLLSDINKILNLQYDKEILKNKIYNIIIKYDPNVNDEEVEAEITNELANDSEQKYRLYRLLTNCDIFSYREKIRDFKLMIINYTGPEEMLPEIFYRLNTGAKNLTKYEVIASLWSDENLYIDENKQSKKMIKELNSYVVEKYEKMENDGYEFDFKGKIVNEDKIFLFDFCESLGRVLSQNRVIDSHSLNYLFSKKNDTSIGFDLLALIFHNIQVYQKDSNPIRINLNKPEHINLIINQNTDSYEIYNLYKSIIDTTNKLNKILSEVLYKTEKSNTKIQGYLAKYMFMYTYDKLYKVNFSNGKLSINKIKFNLEKIRKNIHINLLNDLFTDYWSKNRQLSDFKNLISNNLNKYDSICSKDEFLSNFNLYHTEVRDVNKSKYATKEIKYEVKIITYYMHCFFINTDVDYKLLYKNKDNIDFDHYYAKKWFLDSKSMPYSSVFNIYPIPSKDNKIKGAKDPSLKKNTIIKYNEDFNEILHRPELDSNFKDFNEEEKIDSFNKFCKLYGQELDSIMGKVYDYLSDKYNTIN